MDNTPGRDRPRKPGKVVCVSWNPALAETRRRLLIAELQLFKERSTSPVLSLLLPHQNKLPEADYGVEAYSPRDFLDAVKNILQT